MIKAQPITFSCRAFIISPFVDPQTGETYSYIPILRPIFTPIDLLLPYPFLHVRPGFFTYYLRLRLLLCLFFNFSTMLHTEKCSTTEGRAMDHLLDLLRRFLASTATSSWCLTCLNIVCGRRLSSSSKATLIDCMCREKCASSSNH